MTLTKKPIGSRGLLTNASNRWKFFEGLTMELELPLDFKEFLKLLIENKFIKEWG